MAVAMVNSTVQVVAVHEAVEAWSWKGILYAPHELKTSLYFSPPRIFFCVFSFSTQDVTDNMASRVINKPASGRDRKSLLELRVF